MFVLIGDHREVVTNVFGPTTSAIRVAETNDQRGRVGGGELFSRRVQLRHVITSRQSSKMTNKHDEKTTIWFKKSREVRWRVNFRSGTDQSQLRLQ